MTGGTKWGIDVPNPNVFSFIKKLPPATKSEIYKIVTDHARLFDAFGTAPRFCSSGLFKLKTHKVKGEELYMENHYDTKEKQIRITGFETRKT